MSQNVPTFTGTAAQGDTPTVTNAVGTNQVLYDIVKNTEGTPGIWGPATGGAGTGLVTGGWTSGVVDQGRHRVHDRHRCDQRACGQSGHESGAAVSSRCSPSWPM